MASYVSRFTFHVSDFTRHAWLIARKDFGDRLRSGWVLACVAVCLGAIALTSFFGLLQVGRIGVQGYERTVVSLLNLVQYLVPLLGLLLGHDLIVGEAEDRTLRLVIAGGIGRGSVLIGKFVGASLTLAVPLLLGFIIAGTAIGFSAKDSAIGPFLRLAISGLGLGLIFVGLGLGLSAFARSRVQALVAVLLTWCVLIFAFDLIALGIVVSTKAKTVANEIDIVCDATHVNGAADIHSSFDSAALSATQPSNTPRLQSPSLGWLAANPVDLFRAVNLAPQINLKLPIVTMCLMLALWQVVPLCAAFWKLRRTDL
jgi:Cu-processing system permease protein